MAQHKDLVAQENYHMKLGKPKQIRVYECPECKEQYKNKWELYSHWDLKHN